MPPADEKLLMGGEIGSKEEVCERLSSPPSRLHSEALPAIAC
jgi:hypothetical protein